MPVPPEGYQRGQAMGRRVLRHARSMGLAPDALDLIDRAYTVALDLRARLADDDHDPPFLHPGRSALILLIDAGETDARVLAASMAIDSDDDEWAADLTPLGDSELDALIVQIPSSGTDDLAERLWGADPRALRAALAERLDHLRHAHLWTDLEKRRAAHDEAVRIYAPMAQRSHPRLAHRFAWWCRMFGDRHLSK